MEKTVSSSVQLLPEDMKIDLFPPGTPAAVKEKKSV